MNKTDSILDAADVQETECSFTQRFFTILIDIAIEISLVFAVYLLAPREFIRQLIIHESPLRFMITLGIIFTYRFACIFLMEKTIGMRICKIKYLNHNLQPLTTKEKFIAVFRSRTDKIRFYKIN